MLTTTEPGTHVATHAHDEPMFRYVIEGSLTINGTEYRPGDWVFIPEGVPYDIRTTEGYTTLGCYGQACGDLA